MTQIQERNEPKLRFPGFEGAWEKLPLKDISNVFDGTHQTPEYTTEGVPFVSVENILNIYDSTKFISEEAFNKGFRTKPQKNDILMTRITAGIIGATAIVKDDKPLAYYVSLALIRPKSSVSASFLAQRIESEGFKRELHKRIIHVAFPKKINLGDIGDCVARIPSTSEQRKIADFLSAVDDKIGQLRKKKALFEDYKKGCMERLFSQSSRFRDVNGKAFPEWKKTTLGHLVNVTTGSSNREDSDEVGDYAFFDRSNDMRRSDKYLFDCEAIIVSGEGKDFPPRYFEGKFDLHQRAYAITDFGENSSKFLFFWIGAHRHHFLRFAVGSTMPSLRMSSFDRFPVFLPCPAEQQKIADFLSAIDAKIIQASEELELAQTFKKGLLQQMFV